MNEDIKHYIGQFNESIQSYFNEIRLLIYKSTSQEIEEKMWAKLPSFYAGEKFIRLIPFKDHVNVEAAAVICHKAQLEDFKITPKGMLQIYLRQQIPDKVLQAIFAETLS